MPVYEARITDSKGDPLVGAIPFIIAESREAALACLTRTQRKRLVSLAERVPTSQRKAEAERDGQPFPRFDFKRTRRR